MSRDWRLFLEDMVVCCGEVRGQYPQVEWRKIAGLRDVLAHFYFGLEDETLWDIVRNKIPALKSQLQQIQAENP